MFRVGVQGCLGGLSRCLRVKVRVKVLKGSIEVQIHMGLQLLLLHV